MKLRIAAKDNTMTCILSRCLRKTWLTSDVLALLGMRFSRTSYLKQAGWFASFRHLMPVDANRNAVPWYTYSAIEFLAGRIRKDMAVFEYGSGNSTLWWARRTAQVISCEHDRKWFQKMKPLMPSNVEYMNVNLEPEGTYSAAILQHRDKFDVVLIDGRDRIQCATNALPALKETGIVVWDDAERQQYQKGFDLLTANGFKRLDFTGIAPMHSSGKSTAIFYRERNCLGL